MSDLTTWDYERIVIAHMLKYPDAVKYVLPDLTHDKFLYSITGRFDGAKDHQKIWQAITYLHQVDKVSINVTSILYRLGETGNNTEMRSYLTSLELALPGFYMVRDLDVQQLMNYATIVDRAGIAYQAGTKSFALSKIIQSPEEFNKAVISGIGDVTDWLHGHIAALSAIVAIGKTEGYEHVSASVARAQEKADRIYRGEQALLLPVGMPSVHLPLGKLVVLLAESNAGKSTISNQWALGAGIGLKENGMKGAICINSLEEDDDDLALKMAAMLARVDLYKFRFGPDGITPEDKYRLDRALEYINTLPIYIDNTNMLKSSSMQLRAEGLHNSNIGPLWHVQVDYLELLAQDDGDEIKEQRIDKAIHKCFELSRTTGANVLVLSQVTLGGANTTPSFRIAGPDGARYSKAVRHAADILYEWVNYPELVKAGLNVSCPAGMNTQQPWLLCSKYRNGPKFSPLPFIWEPEFQRSADPDLNRTGSNEIVLFNHPLPSFEYIEAGGF